jgi:hypothetical protein
MYGSVDTVRAELNNEQWDPARHKPSTAEVDAMLEDWSGTLDGEIDHVVETPITSASPKLLKVVTRATVLRVAAVVYDRLNPAGGQEVMGTRQSHVWREQASDLVAGVLKGATADGVARGGRTPDATGAPVGNFPSDAGRFGRFGRGQRF